MNILVTNRHALFREGLAGILKSQFDQSNIYLAYDWKDTHDFISRYKIDLALVDVFMSGTRPWNQELKNLRVSAPSTPICILSGVSTSRDIRAAFELGVKGHLHTKITTLELKEFVQHIASGGVLFPKALWEESTITENQLLTARQTEVVECLINGLSNKRIADSLTLSESTVKRHLSNIFKALGVKSRLEVVQKCQRSRMHSQ